MMYTRTNNKDRHGGFTLVETLIYAVSTALLIGVIVTMLVYSYRWYRYVMQSPRVDRAATSVMHRIQSDIRAGLSVDVGQSSFDVVEGSLGIGALDSSRNPVAHYYALQGNRIVYQKDGGTISLISPEDLYISRLEFNRIDTDLSTAIRYVIAIDYVASNGTTTNTYSGLAIMRNTYE